MTKERLLAITVRNYEHLNPEQRQLVLGTLLGDGSMFIKTNGARGIQFSHCDDQIQYLEWKKSVLNRFIVVSKPSTFVSESYNTTGNLYRSIVHQDFTNIYGLLYRRIKGVGKKFITRRYLNELHELGLLVWFMDDGCVTSDKECRLATNGFSLSEHKAMKIWFWQQFVIESVITHNKTNNTYFLRFNVLNSKKLMRLFAPFISMVPECMQYKFRYHFNLNDYTLNSFASTDIRRRGLKI